MTWLPVVACFVGLFVGVLLGVVVMAALQMSAMTDRKQEALHEQWIRERLADERG